MAKADRGDVPVGLALDGSILAFIGELGGDVDAAMLVDGQVATCSSLQVFDPATNFLCAPVGRDISGRTLVAVGVRCTVAWSLGPLVWSTSAFPRNLLKASCASTIAGRPQFLRLNRVR
jgi:hypothetical protein